MIARKEMTASELAKLDSMIGYMTESEINYPNPYEIAIWADDIKLREHYKLLDGWHFYDQPFCDGIDIKDIKMILDPNFNVVNTVVINSRFDPVP